MPRAMRKYASVFVQVRGLAATSERGPSLRRFEAFLSRIADPTGGGGFPDPVVAFGIGSGGSSRRIALGCCPHRAPIMQYFCSLVDGLGSA